MQAGQRHTAFFGGVVIVALTFLGGDSASNAIPYGAMRMLIVVLPRPSSSGSIVPAEKPLPKAALAVSITPDCPLEAAPGRDEMIALLPEHVGALIGAEGPSKRKRTVRNENTGKIPAISGEGQ